MRLTSVLYTLTVHAGEFYVISAGASGRFLRIIDHGTIRLSHTFLADVFGKRLVQDCDACFATTHSLLTVTQQAVVEAGSVNRKALS